MERNPPQRRPLPTVTVAVVALALLVAACGAAYSRRDYIARADAICATALRQARSIPPPTFGGPSAQIGGGLSAYTARLLPVVRTELGELRALPRPAQDGRSRVTLDRWLSALAVDLNSYRALAAAAKQGDAEGVASAEASLRTSPAPSLAASYGLRACATPGGTVA